MDIDDIIRYFRRLDQSTLYVIYAIIVAILIFLFYLIFLRHDKQE